MELNLSTNAKITWCPGCPNNQILVAFRQAASELAAENKILQYDSRPFGPVELTEEINKIIE